MFRFLVPDMTCGHCVATITKAVEAVDPAAKVAAATATHEVSIDSNASKEELVQAMKDAGYAAQPMGAAA